MDLDRENALNYASKKFHVPFEEMEYDCYFESIDAVYNCVFEDKDPIQVYKDNFQKEYGKPTNTDNLSKVKQLCVLLTEYVYVTPFGYVLRYRQTKLF